MHHTDKIKRFNTIEQGKNDFHRGADYESNPHTLGDIEEFGWWELGWLKAYYFAAESQRRVMGE